MSDNNIYQIPSADDRLIIIANFPNFTPESLYDHFTQSNLLTAWWAHEAPEIDPEIGGKYQLGWSAMGWTLRGVYKAAERGKAVVFTWKWDHEPDLPEREVTVLFQSAAQGSTLTIIHGFYAESEIDQNDRQSHLEGWTHFLGQLRALKS
jgi:uncharacterized protein YndB with AHSA1/START domain